LLKLDKKFLVALIWENGGRKSCQLRWWCWNNN